MMLYTSKSHPDLPDSFGGGSFKDVLAAALKMPALDWVILSNRASQWVSVRKEQISAILSDLDSEEKAKTFPLAPSGGGEEDKFIEDLITRAVHSATEELSPSIDSVLSGRELYLEMTAGRSEGGQPTVKVFQVKGIPNVVRAYLTRRRQGITYGGITWEALKEMISNELAIDGVQIVNDADDWVVFDRQSLRCGPAEESQ